MRRRDVIRRRLIRRSILTSARHEMIRGVRAGASASAFTTFSRSENLDDWHDNASTGRKAHEGHHEAAEGVRLYETLLLHGDAEAGEGLAAVLRDYERESPAERLAGAGSVSGCQRVDRGLCAGDSRVSCEVAGPLADRVFHRDARPPSPADPHQRHRRSAGARQIRLPADEGADGGLLGGGWNGRWDGH